MSTAQTRRVAAEKKAAAKTDAFLEQALQSAEGRVTARRARAEVTAEQIIQQRDTNGLSWKQVAINLDLGSPSAARSAYTKLTGVHHSESGTAARTARTKLAPTSRKTEAVLWDDDTDQDQIIEALTHRNIRVVRTMRGIELPEEWVHVARIAKFAFEGEDEALTVHLYTKEKCKCNVQDPRDADSGVFRAFRIRDIKELS